MPGHCSKHLVISPAKFSPKLVGSLAQALLVLVLKAGTGKKLTSALPD